MATDTTRGSVILFDDFLGDLIDDAWQTSGDTGDTAFAIPTTRGIDGTVQGATAATDNNMIELAHDLNWRVQDGQCVFEVRLQVDSAVTGVAINVGLNDDALEDSNTLPAELATATFTSNAASSVVWVYDVDATNDNWHAFAVDDDNDTNVAIATLNSGVAPVADTYNTMRIVLTDQGSGNMARAEFYIDGALEVTIPSAIDRDVALAPYIGVENRAAGAKTADVDYVFASKSRAAA